MFRKNDHGNGAKTGLFKSETPVPMDWSPRPNDSAIVVPWNDPTSVDRAREEFKRKYPHLQLQPNTASRTVPAGSINAQSKNR
jgi:hypothetical protein